MTRWTYEGNDAATLGELNLDLEPGQQFEAPDDWQPSPNPHPTFRPAAPAAQSAPAPAHEQE